jgi:hypothetical protein
MTPRDAAALSGAPSSVAPSACSSQDERADDV